MYMYITKTTIGTYIYNKIILNCIHIVTTVIIENNKSSFSILKYKILKINNI